MDVALLIFRVGVGIGALLVGIGLVMAVLALRPLVRDARSLARDARRLSRLAEEELPAILAQAREATANAEELTEDLAVRLERASLVAPEAAAPVQSPHAAEDERIA